MTSWVSLAVFFSSHGRTAFRHFEHQTTQTLRPFMVWVKVIPQNMDDQKFKQNNQFCGSIKIFKNQQQMPCPRPSLQCRGLWNSQPWSKHVRTQIVGSRCGTSSKHTPHLLRLGTHVEEDKFGFGDLKSQIMLAKWPDMVRTKPSSQWFWGTALSSKTRRVSESQSLIQLPPRAQVYLGILGILTVFGTCFP